MVGTGDRAVDERLASVERQFWIDRDVALQSAEDWLSEMAEGDHGATSRRLRVLIAAVRIHRTDPSQSAIDVQEILAWAEQHGEIALQSRCHDVLGSVFEMVGDRALALEHAVAANDLLADTETPLMRAAARKCLADTLGSSGSLDEARRRYADALKLVIDDPETNIRYIILNNLAYTEHLAHNHVEALATVERLVGLSELSHRQIGMSARDTIARIYMAAGRLTEAEAMLIPALDTAFSDAHPDSSAAALVALTQLYRTQGRLDKSQLVIDRCRDLAQSNGLIRWTTEASREQAEIFAAQENYRAAFETYRNYHEQSVAVGASENEAKVRILEATFQTAEARRESERYRELAERDPLTGLHNRRFVDEHLGGALLHQREGGPSLAIAMIDLDHFKRVNDTLSHEVGDEVLRTIGRILHAAVDPVPGGVAARLGGEEFLLILPETDAAQARGLAEELCRAIATYDWSPITRGLAVTASIGVALAPADGEQNSDLMRTADLRLYVAKRNGRNRVVHSAAMSSFLGDDSATEPEAPEPETPGPLVAVVA